MKSLFGASPQPTRFFATLSSVLFILFLMRHVYKIFATVPSVSCELAVYHCYFSDLHKCSLLFFQCTAKNCHLCNRFLLLSVPQPTKGLNVAVLSVSYVLSSATVLSVPMTELYAFHALHNSSL